MNKKMIAIGCLLVAFLLLWVVVSLYPDWLWFDNLGFAPVFWTMLFSRFGFGIAIWLVLTAMIIASLYAAKRLNPHPGGPALRVADGYAAQLGLSDKVLNNILIVAILVPTLLVAAKGAEQWDLLLRYCNQQPFGSTDPIFGKDVGFYLFSLPFYLFLRMGLLVLTVLTGLITAGWYLKQGALQIEVDMSPVDAVPTSMPKFSITPNARQHLIFIGGVIALLLAWGYHLKMYELLYSTQGPAFGASYTDVYVKALAYKIMRFVGLSFALALLYTAFKFRFKLIWVSGAVWLGAAALLLFMLPMVIQQFIVKPNELARETPFIGHNISYTREAYNLNKIEEVDFEVKNELTLADIDSEDPTIQNIRVWDERPLLQTYKQIQSIRLYYDFINVDVDRYHIDERYRQVMLAVRELVVDNLPPQANTWVNRHLKYTHGYGLASSAVNELTSEGLPRLLVKDVPPTFEPDLEIGRPEIYYGEKTDSYVLVNTKTEEFDYPKGDKNVYTRYQGKGGVPIGSFLRRLLFAVEFMDPQILFTTYLSPETRIMFKRRIRERARLIAPFLDYDSDPYIVISNGRLYWIQDAYTTSAMYPYSRRTYGRGQNKVINYIRNSVKVTIDAYNGEVAFYLMDESDPIAQTYRKIFPDLLKPFEEMPDSLKNHIRYPKDLFKLQVETYTEYHMEDEQVFYNQEDRWQTPDELYGGSRGEMEPYYIILKLPEEAKEEFLLMIPFTPSQKDNMIGWLAARSDLPNYGNLIVYKLPKEKLVYGPMQIEARVDQQTEISRELSLWGQMGSRVIRGNLLAIPIRDTFIYVEPVYLEAIQEAAAPPPTGQPQSRGFSRQQPRGRRALPLRQTGSTSSALPELKRIIVAYDNRLVMEETLDAALAGVLGEGFLQAQKDTVPVPIGATAETSPSVPAGIRDPSNLAPQALAHYHRAKERLREGDWAGYGKALDDLEKVLKQITEKMEQ